MKPKIKKKTLSVSSKKWLQRQLSDKYVSMARDSGYRSRSAFKLEEINKKHDVLQGVCVDLGSAPGGWSQVAATCCEQVYAVDLVPMENIPNVVFICGDFTDNSVVNRLIETCGIVDVVVSDMAPNTCGIKSADHLRIMELARQALDFTKIVLSHGGCFVTKIFQGAEEVDFVNELKQHFKTVKYCKPAASRKDSVEMYIIAKEFESK